MKRLLIVYHSRTGGTQRMAEEAAAAARREPEVETLLLPAEQAMPAQVLAADGFIFATPENLAAMSGMMKDFFDRCYYPVLERLNGRPYAILVCAGTDGAGAVRQIERIAAGWRLKAAAAPLIHRNGAQTPEAILAAKTVPEDMLARCRETGAAIAAGLAMGIF